MWLKKVELESVPYYYVGYNGRLMTGPCRSASSAVPASL